MNSFVNAAFGADKLLTEDGNKWIYKNKEHGENKEKFSCLKMFSQSFLRRVLLRSHKADLTFTLLLPLHNIKSL